MKAWLFPGQGSQYPGMGRWLWEERSVQNVVAQAESYSGLPLRRLMRNGSSESLRRADVLEPAIAAIQVAYVLCLREQGIRPGVVAGYSMGEIGALFAADVISIEDALEIASLRGRMLQMAAECAQWRMIGATGVPAGYQPGAGTAIAAWNGPGDFTITGEEPNVRNEEKVLIRSGARVSEIPVCGPWHSEMALGVANRIAEKLAEFRFRAPSVPVFLGSTGTCENRPEQLRASLSRQIAAPVLWSSVLVALWNAGVRDTLEIGPGRALTGFLRNNWGGRQYTARFVERENGARPKILSRESFVPAGQVEWVKWA